MTKLFRESDVPLEGLGELSVVVVGYGSQGRGQALNLRDSGCNVSVALREGGASWKQAEQDGWEPITLEEAANGADVVCLLIPDMVQPEVYNRHFAGKLKSGATVLFSHGLNVQYEFIEFSEDLNVIMVAPKGPGALVRREYESGSGVPCLAAVHQDADGKAFVLALSYADAIGGTRAGVIETTFKEETETDLFGEQAVLCGGATELVVAGWETLVDAGYSREVAYFECLHELKLIVDLLYEGGLSRMLQFVSDTAKYGDLTRGKRIINEETRVRMREVLNEIQDGTFAREWRDEYENGGARYRKLLDEDKAHPIEDVGREIRRHFSWLNPEQQEVTT
ncbi:MAG: ketol-acid reductoisomerase [Planctomycetota bacterium]